MRNRTFIPGSEWVYFKIYTGTKTADTILKNELYEFVKDMLQYNIIDKWFFIRYSDTDFHLRLRLHLKVPLNFNSVFNRFFELLYPLVDTGLVWNIQCDTYQQELERYGVNTIPFVEDFFFIDSDCILRLLNQLNDDNPEEQRWKLALILIDSFLSAFSIDLQKRKELLNMLAESYKKEFGFTHHSITKKLNDKYRYFRKDIENTMLWEKEATEIIEIIKARMQAISLVSEKISLMEKTGEFQVSLESLLTNMIHMTMNRWFRTKNRLHEMVIYEFQSRYYTSKVVKNQQKVIV